MLTKIITTYKTSFSGLSRETWLLSTVMLINRSSSMAVPFMSLYMTQYLDRSPSDAGLIITLFGVGSIAGAAAGGKLTDMIGFRLVQILASVIGGLFFILYASIIHFDTLCLLTLVISFFSEAFRPANFAAIATYAAPGTQTRSYSLNRLATNLGWAVGSGIGGIVASFSYPMLFILDGTVSMLSGLLIVILLPAAVARVAMDKPEPSDQEMVGTEIMKPWKDMLFVKFLLLTTMLTTCFFLMFRVVPLYYKTVWHINELHIGLILGFNGLIIAAFEMVMISKIQNKRSGTYYIVKGVLLIALAYLMLMLPGFTPVMVALISIVLFTMGEMFALPFINTFVMSRSNSYNRGQYAAGYTLSWSVAQVIGPSAGFYLAERLGYSWLWVMIIVLLLLCANGFRLLGRRMDY